MTEARAALQSRLLLFFIGASRSANAILQKQRSATCSSEGSVLKALHALRSLAHETRDTLESGQIDSLGEILHEGWMLKRTLAEGISNPHIDEIYERARACGAAGGKVTGAGGGGFLLLYSTEGYQPAVCREMASLGLYRMDFNFDEGGAKILMNSASRSAVGEGVTPLG